MRWIDGPWSLKRDPAHFDSLSSVCAGDVSVCEVSATGETQEATASLISAAPDLYTAHILRDKMDGIDYDTEFGNITGEVSLVDLEFFIPYGFVPPKSPSSRYSLLSRFVCEYVICAMKKARGE